ncbi:hypothetical protein [Anoxybacillus flavithermus]|uniref:Uncharacterized protein n=1 Tax=Anoxybacillus flavithermus TaxID=33934 RepID=A0A178TP93_9BACL|nr:hypothetical protein [Anoxybacillus flavithermus]OAO83366.1 hypothetical protein TAF16_0020 [Anoxybacillus flavithermus]
MLNASPNFIKAMLSKQYKVYIKIELYDSQMRYIKEITQRVNKDIGTLRIDGNSPIRRAFTLHLDNKTGEFIFGENNLIWIDKRLKLYLGLQLWKGNIEYIPLGVFVLTEPEDNHTLDGKSVTINAVDKAFFMTDKRGKFVNEQIIQTGTKITDAIKIIASHVGETMFNFDDVQDTVPYELTYSGEDNRWDAIQELATLAKCTVFYDVYGYLRLKKIDLNYFETEPITWEYKYGDPNERLYAGNVRKFDDSNLYNDIVVLGGSGSTATSRYRLTVDETNPIWTNNPYSVQKIGYHTFFWNNGNPDPLLGGSDEECKWRAKFELMRRLGFAENVELTISPNYLHDVDDVIWIEDKENGIEGNKYLIRSITLPLAPALMTIECTKYRRVISDWNFI